MNIPRKAIVLAAGFGSRLLPLTLLKPKPLFPVWGKPVLGHTLELLHRWGVREVLINAHHQADQILAYLQSRPVKGLKYQVSFEPDILGTGGVLPKACWFLDDRPFWMLNADVMADLDCIPLIKAFEKKSAIASLWLHPERGPRTVEHRDGLVSVGDMGYLDEEGFLYVCDRASDMVISGGVNIYPAEIEHVLITLPGIADCAVVGIPDEEFGESLAAQVVAEAGVTLNAEAIRKALAERIAGYKVPRRIDIVEALPRDDNGKVVKRRIRDAYGSGKARKI